MNTTLVATQTQTQPQPWLLPATHWAWYAPAGKIETVAAGFAPISLAQMDAVALLNRIDTKFVLTTDQLASVLTALRPDYWMLAIDSRRLNHYRTLYFDTPDFELYTAHVTDRAERYKVRSREYTDSHVSFLEVKHHTRRDRTIKERLSTTRPVIQPTPDMSRWLQNVSPLDGNELEPKLWNTFTRLTLVNKHACERVTLDIDLTFYAADQVVQLNGLAVAEVKMAVGSQTSPFLAQMRARRIQPRGFSKYALGVALLYDRVKKNALKPKLLWLDKLMTGAVRHD
ncbi:MAG: polyphosphate polymerase domain-containing protein [Chloroflexi bacterium]|nr:polyphosphate polymerase domain-containing protein [Chloroflexota bacterium]